MARVALITAYDNFAMGLRIMASCLKESGHTVKVVLFRAECQKALDQPLAEPVTYHYYLGNELRGIAYDASPWTERELALLSQVLSDFAPDLIGVGVRSFLDTRFGDIASAIRRGAPEALLVCGGYGPTLSPALYLNWADVVVIGDGERAIVALADGLSGSSLDLSTIPGAMWVDDSGIRTGVPEQVSDLDALPFPLYRSPELCVIDRDTLHDHAEWALSDYTTLLARGCIGQCSYCSAGLIADVLRRHGARTVKRRYRSVRRVIDELKSQVTGSDVRIGFQDSYFTGPIDYLLEFFALYKREVHKRFLAQLYPPQIVDRPDILEAAVDAGLYATVVGVQSGNEDVRRHIYNRRITNEQTLRFSRLCHEYAIEKHYHLIAGCPLESEDASQESARFVATLPFRPGNDQLLVFQFYAFPETPIRRQLLGRGDPQTARECGHACGDPITFMKWAWHYQIALYGGPAELAAVCDDPRRADLEWLKARAQSVVTARHGRNGT